MGRKAGKYKKKEENGLQKKKSIRFDSDNEDMMNDEIDAFHKKRDVVPLNINDDLEASEDDAEEPVLDFEDDEEEDDEDIDDDKPAKGLAAKIIRAQKFLWTKFGDSEDKTLDDADEELNRVGLVKKSDRYGADVDNELHSSDDEDAVEEETAAVEARAKIAAALSEEDFGLEDASLDETDREPTFEEILDHGKTPSKASLDKGIKEEEGMSYELVKKDLNALTKEEQMDVVYSSAPEVIGLLSELKDALEQLQNKVNPLVEKIKGKESAKRGTMHYIEVKQLLLQSFCQAITFYLLLKSEGQPVRDHPVLSRLVEIKTLLDKIKKMDDNLSFDMEEILNKEANKAAAVKLVEKTAPVETDSFNNGQMHSKVASAEQAIEPKKEVAMNTLKSPKAKESKNKHQDKQVGQQSMEMLKLRASLEEKLRQQGVYSSIAPKAAKSSKNQQPVNRQLETLDDFVDEAMEIDGVANGRSNGYANLSRSSKISQQLTLRPNKRKVMAGDDDIPKRDDIGERRRKYELRVLAGAGVQSGDDVADENGGFSSDAAEDAHEESGSDSDLEFYKQVERTHAEKLAAKSAKYTRTPEVPSLPETVDGKRHINNQIEKNRGLTRQRNKSIKNPRKKYKLKHKKREVGRKGQVRVIRKPTGNVYGGEASGINAGISRSVRFKN